MKRLLIPFMVLIPLVLSANGIRTKLIQVDTAYSATSVNVAVFRTNSVITRDVERGSCVTIYTGDIHDNELTAVDVTEFCVDAWEPSIDIELWKLKHRLHIYVQNVAQGDGEKITSREPQPVYILEIE